MARQAREQPREAPQRGREGFPLKKVQRPCLTPAQWLSRKIEPADNLLGELFSTTSRTLFAADTGAGKTMFGMACAFAMQLGRYFLRWRGRRHSRVLYIDGEMPRDLMQERIDLCCDWFDVDAPKDGPLFLSREDFEGMPPFDTPEGQKWLNSFIQRFGPFDFINFDNIMSLCSTPMTDEESWQVLKAYVLSLSHRRIGQLWIHHTGHDKTRAYGTKTREWHMDTVIIGEKAGTLADVSMILRFDKARRRKPSNQGDFESVQIQLKNGAWSCSEPVDVPTGRPNKSEEIALEALRHALADFDEGVPVNEWRKRALEFGISKSSNEESRRAAFRRAITGLVNSGKVMKLDGERYSIAE